MNNKLLLIPPSNPFHQCPLLVIVQFNHVQNQLAFVKERSIILQNMAATGLNHSHCILAMERSCSLNLVSRLPLLISQWQRDHVFYLRFVFILQCVILQRLNLHFACQMSALLEKSPAEKRRRVAGDKETWACLYDKGFQGA